MAFVAAGVVEGADVRIVEVDVVADVLGLVHVLHVVRGGAQAEPEVPQGAPAQRLGFGRRSLVEGQRLGEEVARVAQ